MAKMLVNKLTSKGSSKMSNLNRIKKVSVGSQHIVKKKAANAHMRSSRLVALLLSKWRRMLGWRMCIQICPKVTQVTMLGM